MSFFYTAINERLGVAQGRVPLAFVTHTGTRCAPVPSRFYLHVLATQNKNERLVFTQGRDAHLCLLAFYLHVLIIQNPKRKTGSYSGTKCTPVPSRFLSSCPSFTRLYMKDWQLLRDVCLWHKLHTQGRDAHLCLSLLSSCRCYTKQKMRNWYLLRDEMRTCAFSLSIFMSLLYTSRNERLEVTQGRDVHLCLLAFYLHVLLLHNYK